MKTLLSINNYYYYRGGAETVFFSHNRLMDESRWRVVPFAMRHPRNLPSEYQENFVDEIEYGHSYPIKKKIMHAQNVLYSFEAKKKIQAVARRYRPAIAHAHNIYHHLSPAIFSGLKEMGIPAVLTLHDLKIACPAYKMLAQGAICERCKQGGIKNVVLRSCIKNSLLLSSIVFLEALLHRWLKSYSHSVDKFIVPSAFYREKLVEWGWPRDKFVHIPNFIDVTGIDMAGADCGAPFVYVGRLAPEKGLATFVKAIAAAGVEGWIVGTGPEEPALRALAEDRRARVRFIGHQDKSSLFALMRQARAIVLPSEWYENAPLSLMESYALGIPVIGAAIGGIPELIVENQTGMLFQSGSVESLAACLVRMQDMPDTDVREMGRCGNALVRQGFGPQQYKQRIFELYRSLGGEHV